MGFNSRLDFSTFCGHSTRKIVSNLDTFVKFSFMDLSYFQFTSILSNYIWENLCNK